MRIGTKSLLFGCHQFLIHPIFTLIGWILLYKIKSISFQVIFAIFIHDWGYYSCKNMDGPEDGALHPFRICTFDFVYHLFPKAYDEILYHSRHLAKIYEHEPSRLCWADKLGTGIMPSILWAILACASKEGWEYMDNKYGHDYVTGEDKTLMGLYRFHQKYKKEWGLGGSRWKDVFYAQN